MGRKCVFSSSARTRYGSVRCQITAFQPCTVRNNSQTLICLYKHFWTARTVYKGHVLYPTAMCLADFLAENAKAYIRDKCVLELGAGGGLPSLVSVLEGASKVGFTTSPPRHSSLMQILNLEHTPPIARPSQLISQTLRYCQI